MTQIRESDFLHLSPRERSTRVRECRVRAPVSSGMRAPSPDAASASPEGRGVEIRGPSTTHLLKGLSAGGGGPLSTRGEFGQHPVAASRRGPSANRIRETVFIVA